MEFVILQHPFQTQNHPFRLQVEDDLVTDKSANDTLLYLRV